MHTIYESRQLLKYIFIFFAILIGIASLIVSNVLVKDLQEDERRKIQLWASATETLATGDENTDMSMVLEIIASNTTIPVILYDKSTGALSANNIKLPEKNSDAFLLEKINRFERNHLPIALKELDQFVYYDDSYTLKNLQLYPYIQLGVMGVFIALAFFALSSSKKAEQNKVWVGLSKETAHQLGTPISSLIAWVEYLKMKDVDSKLISEIDKDVHRLEMIAERFSKIGSVSDIKPIILQETIHESVHYLSNRISGKVQLTFDFPHTPIHVMLNKSLFGWVIENLTKNAVDAMGGQGKITYAISERGNQVRLDITDTGKGIPKSKFNAIFSPGYTTKDRGWGLGLSLAKRIVETYHKGQVFVKRSEIGKGTKFRIALRKYKK